VGKETKEEDTTVGKEAKDTTVAKEAKEVKELTVTTTVAKEAKEAKEDITVEKEPVPRMSTLSIVMINVLPHHWNLVQPAKNCRKNKMMSPTIARCVLSILMNKQTNPTSVYHFPRNLLSITQVIPLSNTKQKFKPVVVYP